MRNFKEVIVIRFVLTPESWVTIRHLPPIHTIWNTKSSKRSAMSFAISLYPYSGTCSKHESSRSKNAIHQSQYSTYFILSGQFCSLKMKLTNIIQSAYTIKSKHTVTYGKSDKLYSIKRKVKILARFRGSMKQNRVMIYLRIPYKAVHFAFPFPFPWPFLASSLAWTRAAAAALASSLFFFSSSLVAAAISLCFFSSLWRISTVKNPQIFFFKVLPTS